MKNHQLFWEALVTEDKMFWILLSFIMKFEESQWPVQLRPKLENISLDNCNSQADITVIKLLF